MSEPGQSNAALVLRPGAKQHILRINLGGVFSSGTEQNRTEQSRTEQSRTEQNRTGTERVQKPVPSVIRVLSDLICTTPPRTSLSHLTFETPKYRLIGADFEARNP